jgi:hypothetical protein
MPIPAPIQSFIDAQADRAAGVFADLRAVVFNGTLKRSPEPSHTDGLLAISTGLMERVGVRVDEIRTVDHEIPPGVWPDMTEHGYERDDFPALYRELVAPADIILIAGPIWLGDQSSLTRKAIERLYAYSGDVNAAGHRLHDLEPAAHGQGCRRHPGLRQRHARMGSRAPRSPEPRVPRDGLAMPGPGR